MKVTILGSGTCVPHLERSAAAALVETGSHKLLIDAGPGTMRRLLEHGLSIFDVTHLLITHFHPDHTAELVPLLFATKYPDAGKRKHPLVVMGAPGLLKFYQKLQIAYRDWIVLSEDQVRFLEVKKSAGPRFGFEDCRIEAYSVDHRPESRAYRMTTTDGWVVSYSGDSDYCRGLISAARCADLFICECAYPDGLKVAGHMTPELAGRVARKARAKQLVLTHMYPSCDQVDIVKQAQKVYQNGPVIVASDLMCFELNGMDR